MRPTADDLRAWLVGRIAEQTHLPPAEVRADASLAEYGLDSVTAITLCVEVEEEFGVPLELEDMWEHPTVDALCTLLLERIAGAA